MNELEKKYVGKIVATRGIGSGVNAGVFLGFGSDNKTVFLTNAYFLRNWKYKNSFGSMASLSSGDIIEGGEIAKIHHDAIITDCACIVVIEDKDFLNKCEKFKK